MSEKKKKKLSISYAPGDDVKLIPDEDEEFEREAAERYREEIEEGETAAREAERHQEEQKRAYEQKLRQEKIAMMKAKQGIEEEADGSDTQEEENEPPAKMSFKKKLENFWYHYKIVTIVIVVAVLFGGYMIYDLVTKVNPDIIVIVTSDNGLSYRADAVQMLFEKYADDVNGDGKVNVEVIFTPMNAAAASDQVTQGNETKLYANLANAQCVLYITDTDSGYSLEPVAFDDLSESFDSKYVTADGISLDCGLIREGFNWAQMPDDMVMKIRTPVTTLVSSSDDMRETYDDAMRFIERLVAAMDEYDVRE